ncbi:zinc ribbon domain-containing protein [Streptomyces luteireticuli]|uniref:DZANK-type domain-containing protein n=1 Tax=Streptomyces luteireticuli TaxID=173858 RepID=A0ABN0Z503_9ACTN
MGEEIYFGGNYRDLCEHSGTAAGFQFEFSCWRCHDTWRSSFEPYRSGRLASWLNKGIGAASGVLGRAVSEVSTAVGGLADSGWGTARDASFRRAIAAAEGHFNRCARCASYVCGRCWHPDQGLCFTCAPDTAGEQLAARQRGVNDAVTQRAYDEGQRQAEGHDVRTPRQLVCPHCRAEAHGGRFCPACGTELAQRTECGGCRAVLPEGAAFCPECGRRR